MELPSGDIHPILGQAVGVYRERPAAAPLAAHFSRTWFHAVPSGALRRSAIVPDGCADLIWSAGSLRIAGPDRTAKIEELPPGATVVGLRFQPGALAAWLRIPASDLVAARPRLEDFWGNEARRVADWVSEGRSAAEVGLRLETAMARVARGVKRDDGWPAAIFGLVEAHQPAEGQLVDRLTGATGWSERTLRRRCHEAFGYGPKTLERILRFQRFLSLARGAVGSGLAGIAFEAGYADQAHLTRETRALAGFTPSSVVAQLSF